MMSDEELNTFQVVKRNSYNDQNHCFGSKLTQEEIASIKRLIEAEGTTRCEPEGIPEEGFITLMRLFVQRDRAETVWTVLIAMQYNESLQLNIPQLSLLPYVHYELSVECQQFLIQAYVNETFLFRSSEHMMEMVMVISLKMNSNPF